MLGASGAVGIAALQLARAFSARVLAGISNSAHAHEALLAIAKKAAEKTRRKKSVVSVAPEVDPEDDTGRPPVPAGRKSLRVVN